MRLPSISRPSSAAAAASAAVLVVNSDEAEALALSIGLGHELGALDGAIRHKHLRAKSCSVTENGK
jgi:hypothetical protein